MHICANITWGLVLKKTFFVLSVVLAHSFTGLMTADYHAAYTTPPAAPAPTAPPMMHHAPHAPVHVANPHIFTALFAPAMTTPGGEPGSADSMRTIHMLFEKVLTETHFEGAEFVAALLLKKTDVLRGLCAQRGLLYDHVINNLKTLAQTAHISLDA